MFVGRERERARIDRLLTDARAGRSGALLLHGEAGIGKTALMRWAIGHATGMRVLRARGIETESDIPFAGLGELVTPLLDRLDAIPDVQADALRGALALGPATPHDRFTVPAGLLSLLAVAAEEQPVLVAIDDAQWLDESSVEAFLFAGRRIGAEGIAMLGSLRDGTAVAGMEVPWLERLSVSPLGDGEARELLGSERLAPSVAERLVSTAAGNPLALLEIPRLLSDGQRAGREPLEEPLRPGTGVERAFRRTLDALDDSPRRALLVAATAPTGRIEVIEPALRECGLTIGDLAPAEEARLISTADGEVEFRHPLVRSTAYHAAGAAERRGAHAALAAAAPEGSPERAWHLAACAVAPDEAVAAALEAAALDARGRGAHATAARDFGRAAQLTPGEEPRARRLLEAATDATRAGEADRAFALLGEASRLASDPLLAADIQRMTGHVEMRRGSPRAAYELLVAEAERVRSRDPRRAAGMFLEASVSHMITGDMHALVATAERARALATAADPAVELLATAVIGEAYLALGDVEHGDALLSACEPYLLEGDPLAIVEVVGMAAHSSIWIEKFDRAQRIFDRLVAAARDASAVSALIYPLAARSHLDFRLGRWAAARAHADEAVELAQDTGQLPLLAHGLAALAHIEAATGQEEACRDHVTEGLALVARLQGDAIGAYLNAALGLLELGLGRIPEAIARARGDAAHGRPAADAAVAGDEHARPRRGLFARGAARRGAGADRRLRGARPHDGLALGGGRRGAPAGAARARGRGPPAVRGRARAPRRPADAVRARAYAAVLRRAPAPGAPARGGARAAEGRARHLRAPGRAQLGRAHPHRAAGDRRAAGAPDRDRGRAAHPARAADRRAGGAGHDQPGGGGGALPLAEDDRVPPGPDLPQARRARPRPARPADGDGAAGGRA